MKETWLSFVSDWLAPAAPILALIGVLTPLIITLMRDNKTLRADVYFKLEMEASRLFEISRQSPDMMNYLEGRPVRGDDHDLLRHEIFWYLPQVLNLFEISILFRHKGIFDKATFSTWIAWYLELGGSERFCEFWRELRVHYRPELRAIMDAAAELSSNDEADLETTTEMFFGRVGSILKDRSILPYYKSCLEQSNMDIGMNKITMAEHRKRH